MSITRVSGFSATWTVTRTVTASAAAVSDSAFQALMSIGQLTRDGGTRQTESQDLPLTLSPAEGDAAVETLVPDSLFTYWANLRITDERFYTGDGIYQGFSRYMTMMQDYRDWKREQPESGLPASLGSEEANLAWLRVHFSGELDAFGVIDAIESMYSMGMIDRYEHNCVYGMKLTIVKATELVSTIRELPPGYDPYWDDGFENAPLMELRTLDDILEWLGKFRTMPVADWEIQWRELLKKDGIEERYSVPV